VAFLIYPSTDETNCKKQAHPSFLLKIKNLRNELSLYSNKSKLLRTKKITSNYLDISKLQYACRGRDCFYYGLMLMLPLCKEPAEVK
jgi:hypothetical protein